MLTIYNSFSKLLNRVAQDDIEFNDDPNNLYYFGCSKSGIEQTIENGKIPKFIANDIVSEIEKAERFGRVFWKEMDEEENLKRFHLFLEKMREMGIKNVPDPTLFSGKPEYSSGMLPEFLEPISDQIYIY